MYNSPDETRQKVREMAFEMWSLCDRMRGMAPSTDPTAGWWLDMAEALDHQAIKMCQDTGLDPGAVLNEYMK